MIDWDAYIANRTLGTDVPTSLAGSIDDDSPAPVTTRDKRAQTIGIVIGVSVVLAWVVYRML